MALRGSVVGGTNRRSISSSVDHHIDAARRVGPERKRYGIIFHHVERRALERVTAYVVGHKPAVAIERHVGIVAASLPAVTSQHTLQHVLIEVCVRVDKAGGDDLSGGIDHFRTFGGQAAPDAFPTGVPLNESNYQEFTEPKTYEVIEDCITWSGNDVQTSGGDLVQGSLVTGVATDGTYLILDDQRVVELTHVQLFE